MSPPPPYNYKTNKILKKETRRKKEIKENYNEHREKLVTRNKKLQYCDILRCLCYGTLLIEFFFN